MIRKVIFSICALSSIALVDSTLAHHYTDLATDHYAYEAIHTLFEQDIIKGYDDGTFRPSATINRAEAVKIAVEVAKQSGLVPPFAVAKDYKDPLFIDVPEDTWFTDAVYLGYEYGILSGYQDAKGNLTGAFGPSDTVTRAQAAKILFLASAYQRSTGEIPSFKDVSTRDWYYNYVLWAYNMSMVNGYEDSSGTSTGYFGPNDKVTRGAFAKMAATALQPVPRMQRNCTGTGTQLDAVCGLPEMKDRVVPNCTGTGSGSDLHCTTMHIDHTKFLLTYPFAEENIKLVEGFSVYDGHLGDPVGVVHKGVDYVLFSNGEYQNFDVYSMHGGYTAQGNSPSWGKYVIVYHPDIIEGKRFSTVYAHLENIPYAFPWLKTGQKKEEYPYMPVNTYLGIASTTGTTNDIPQLHIEIHERYEVEGTYKKLDPYGVFDRYSSNKYPQPGRTLNGIEHYWTQDLPPLVSDK